MRVLVTGASGLIGSALAADFEKRGDSVVRLVRRPPREAREAFWDPAAGAIDGPALERFDAIVHLAGENLAAGRWTKAKKQRIWRSRVDATRLLTEAIARLTRPPRVLIAASGVGFYGDRGDERLDESSPKGRGFIADLVEAWEASSASASPHCRVVIFRNGLVLSARGGVLARLLPIFRFGLGGPIAGGRAWWSWIAIDDLIAAVRFAIEREALSGPINATAPGTVTNAALTRALGRVLGRPAVLPVPAFALRLAFGEMADEMLLASARVEPTALVQAGFPFRFPELERALRHELERPGGGGDA
jgi:uncharacterized protein